MSNAESDWWNQQRRQELTALSEEAHSLGIDVEKVIGDAPIAFRKLKQLGYFDELMKMDIRSELDATIGALRGAIRKAKASQISN